MPTPGVIKGSDHFFITTYEGNGGGAIFGYEKDTNRAFALSEEK